MILRGLGLTFGLLAALFAVMCVETCNHYGGDMQDVAPFVLLHCVCSSIAGSCFRQARVGDQSQLNELAEARLRQLESDQTPEPFALYLRPFFSDGNLHISNPEPGWGAFFRLSTILDP